MRVRFPPVAGLLPHRAPMLLLTKVSEHSREAIVCIGAIPPGYPIAANAEVPAIIGVELAAQAAGAHEALRRRAGSDGTTQQVSGFLVAIRSCRFFVPSLPIDKPLKATVRLVGNAGQLTIYDATVSRDGRREQDVTCRFSIYATDLEDQVFGQSSRKQNHW